MEAQLPLVPLLLVEGAEQALQPLDVLDGAAQDLHLGQPLVGVQEGAALQSLERLVHLLEAPLLPQRGGAPPVHGHGFPLAHLAGPGQALPGTVLGQRLLVLGSHPALGAQGRLGTLGERRGLVGLQAGAQKVFPIVKPLLREEVRVGLEELHGRLGTCARLGDGCCLSPRQLLGAI